MDTVGTGVEWVREHVFLTVVGALVLLLVGLAVVTLGGTEALAGVGASQQFAAEQSLDAARLARGDGVGGDAGRPQSSGGGESFVEVKEADFTIETDAVEAAASRIRQMTTQEDGYVEQSRKESSDLYTRIHMTVRVPRSSFSAYTDRLQQQFMVESYTVRNFRVSTRQEIDELTILNRTLADYEEIRSQIQQMPTGREKIDLLMDVTEKELELEEKERRFQRELSEKERQGRFSTVRIELRDRKSVDVWPDNIWNRFKKQVKEMLDKVVTIAIDTVTGGVTLFFQVIQLIVYAVIVLLPLGLAYRYGRKLAGRLQGSQGSDNDAIL